MIWAIRIKRKVLPQNLANIINFSSLTPPVLNVICHLKYLFQTVYSFTASYIQLKIKTSSQENIECVSKRFRIWQFWVMLSFYIWLFQIRIILRYMIQGCKVKWMKARNHMCSQKYWGNKSSDKTFFHKITQYRKIKISCTLGVRIRLPQFRSAWILKPICNLSFDLCFTSKNFKTVLTYSVTRLCTFQFFLEWLYSKNYVICKKYYSSVKLHFWKFKVTNKWLLALVANRSILLC